MKKAETMLDAVGFIDEAFIAEADEIRGKKKLTSKRKILMASAACLCVVAAGYAVCRAVIPGNSRDDRRWEYYEMSGTDNSSLDTVALIPKWEEMSITQKFYELEFQGGRYSVGGKPLASYEKVGEKLGSATLSGYDVYEDKSYTASVGIYGIKGISDECAVAVKFENDDAYYPYYCFTYKPATLGEFCEKLNLRENLTTGGVYLRDMKNGKDDNATIYFENVSTEKIWEYLLKYSDAAAAEDYDSMWLSRKGGMSANIEILGIENLSISFSDDGWLVTNLLATGKAFYIGEEAVEEFIEFLVDECEGVQIVSDAGQSGETDSDSDWSGWVSSPSKPVPEATE